MSETHPVVIEAVDPQPELALSNLNPVADRLISLHVDKLLFAIVGLLFLGLAVMYTWLYFHPSW